MKDDSYTLTMFKKWDYEADTTGIREYSHSIFKIFYDRIGRLHFDQVTWTESVEHPTDRIPFKLDIFFTFLLSPFSSVIHNYEGQRGQRSNP